jgi:hypothetical protein
MAAKILVVQKIVVGVNEFVVGLHEY